VLQRIEHANELHGAGDTEAAVAAFAALENDFRNPVLSRLLPTDRARVSHNYLRLLYLTEDYDRVIEEAEAQLMAGGAVPPLVPFWLGNAYYRKALSVEGDDREEEARAWLRRAGERYRDLILRSTSDWDVKYNHELVQTLLRRADQQADQEIFELLRPSDKMGPEPPQPTGGRIG
jgi:hypothetical protein